MKELEVVYPEFVLGIRTGNDIVVFHALLTDKEMNEIKEYEERTKKKVRFHTNKEYKCIAGNKHFGQLEKYFNRTIKRTILIPLVTIEVYGVYK